MFNVYYKILKLVYKFDKFGVIKLNFILIFSSIIEGLSIALIFPIIGLVVDNKKSYIFFDNFPFINLNPESAVFFALLFLLIIFSLKSMFLLYFSWWKSGFIFKINNSFSKQVFENYLDESLEFYLKNKPSHLLRNSYNEMRIFIQSVDVCFRLLSELIVFIFVSFVLFFYQPYITMIIFLFFGFLGSIYIFFTKNLLKNWSFKKLNLSGKIIQILQQSFESIKYIKVSNIEEKIVKKYEKKMQGFSEYSRYGMFFGDIPKIFLELTGVIVLCITIFFLYEFESSNLQNILPNLGLFTAASFRLIPGINRIVNSVQSIYGTSASINTVYSDLVNKKNKYLSKFIKKISFNNSIEFKNVSYSYPDSKNYVFKKLNFKINKSDCVCIRGKSGIGKTTIIDLMCGLIKPTEGSILIDGKELSSSQAIQGWQRNIGYIPQSTTLYDATILENITFSEKGNIINEENLKKAINYSQLDEFVNNKSDGLNYNISERGSNLSGGQAQRFAIARSLYMKPDILICDEFTSSIDEETQEKILESLNLIVGNTTMVFISHNNKVIKKANKIFEIKKDQNETVIIN